jgi:hypothetical protein
MIGRADAHQGPFVSPPLLRRIHSSALIHPRHSPFVVVKDHELGCAPL